MAQAVIVSDPADFAWLREHFAAVHSRWLAANYYTWHVLQGQAPIEYLYEPSTGDSAELDAIYDMALHWYRDADGRDLLFAHGFSIGPVIGRTVINAFANDYRNRKALLQWLDRVECIHVPRQESRSLVRTASDLGERIRWYDRPTRDVPSMHTSSPERTILTAFPDVHRLSKIARWVQRPFVRWARRRSHLYFTDWTSRAVASQRNDTLLGNCLIPWRGHYFHLSPRYLAAAEVVVPPQIAPAVLSLEHLRAVARRRHIPWDDDLLRMWQRTLEAKYEARNQALIRRAYALYKELLAYYRPSLISLPGEAHFAYVVALQVARQLGIRTMLVLDGYQIWKDVSAFYRDEHNTEFLFDRFACFGAAHRDLLCSAGVAPHQCVLMAPLILQEHRRATRTAPQYDAIIMAFYPHLHNPQARWDSAYQSLLEVIAVLRNLGQTRLAIKAKPGDYYTAQGTIEKDPIAQAAAADPALAGIDILGGQLHEHIGKTRCVVGQISTAVLEAFYQDIPYYVYEPYADGKSDAMIQSATILSLATIARTPEQLQDLITRGEPSVRVSRDYVLAGPSFATVDLFDDDVPAPERVRQSA